MTTSRRFNFSVLVPLALIAVSLWLLVGCLYIPTPEMVFRTGSKKDFRPLVGEPGSGKPIVVGRISRAGVEAMLGPPPFASSNRRRSMYVIHIKKDILIMPLCFSAVNDSNDAVGVVLNFDEAGMLREWTQINGPTSGSPFLNESWGPAEAFDMEKAGDAQLLAQGNTATTQPYSDEWQLRATKRTKWPW